MARIEKRSLTECHTQPRGWGREHWIENLPEYCGKILVVEPGKRGSLHFHEKKTETMYVMRGVMCLRLIDTDTAQEYCRTLEQGDSILLRHGQPHQIINADDMNELVLVEFSTTHEETDSRRLQKGD